MTAALAADGAAGASPQELLARAAWISPDEGEVPAAGSRPAYELATTFTLGQLPSQARLAATAHGVYEAFLNGERVGDHELSPGLTSYRRTLHVQHHDVTHLLRPGANELRLVLSDGWFRGRCGPARVPDGFGTRTAVIAQLDAEADGVRTTVVTDLAWRWRTGPVLSADLMDGQHVDLRRVDEDDDWRPVVAATGPLVEDRGRLALSPAPPVRRVQVLPAVSVRRLPSGRQVVDVGQNTNGWVRLAQLGPRGTELTLTHAEALDADGDVTTDHLRYQPFGAPEPLPAGQVDRVVSRGVAGDVFEPRHTTHGFRYVAVDGLEEDLGPESVAAVLVRSDLRPTGGFTSSDPRLDALHRIAVASWRANSCDVPTDCPQRERWGYTGDYQVFVPSAALLDDVEGFSVKWLQSLADDQLPSGCITNVAPNVGVEVNPLLPFSFDGSAGWGDAATIVPWQVFRSYGDPDVLARSLPVMARWVDYASGVAATQRHPSRVARGPELPHERHLWDAGFHWGEWSEPDVDFDPFADPGIVATAYLHRSASIVARSAAVLGDDERAARYGELAEQVLDAWRREFVVGPGRLTVETQANYVRALAFGLLPQDQWPAAADRLAQLVRDNGTRLSTGFLSTAFLLPVLADHGHVDLAYELLFQDREPSWMTMLDRGATTVWESWRGVDAEGTPRESLNHYSKGSYIVFLYERVAGLRLAEDDDAAGYRRAVVQPLPGGPLTSAGARLQTRHGLLSSHWRTEGGEFHLEVRIPPGCEARVVMPDGTQHEVGAGEHQFRS